MNSEADFQELYNAARDTEIRATFQPKPWAVALLAATWSILLLGVVWDIWWFLLGGLALLLGSYWLLGDYLRPPGVRQAVRGVEAGSWWAGKPKHRVWLYLVVVFSPLLLSIAKDISAPIAYGAWAVCAALSYPACMMIAKWNLPDA